MRSVLLAFVLSFSFALAAAGAQSQFTNPTVAYANLTVNNAAYYISQVNESGYLIFYPNLTQAYADLFKAESTYNTSPITAVVYANKAVNEATSEYIRISSYKSESVVVMAAATIVLAIVIARTTRRIRKSGK